MAGLVSLGPSTACAHVEPDASMRWSPGQHRQVKSEGVATSG